MERQSREAVIGGMLALVVAMGIGRFAFTPALAYMQLDLGLSDAQGGQLASLNYAGYLLGALGAAAVPTGSRRIPFLASLLISVTATALMAAGTDPLMWNILRFASGTASAFLFVLASGIALDSIRGNSRGNGLLFSGVGTGIALTGILAPVGYALGGWSGTWLTYGFAGLLLSIPAAILLKEPEIPHRTLVFGRTRTIPLHVLMISYFCGGLGYIVTGTFIVVFVERTTTVPGMGSVVWTFVGLAAAPSCILWARLGQRWGLSAALVAAFLILSVGVVLPALSSSIPVFLLSALLYGGTFMGIVLLTMSLGKLTMPENSGRAVGLLTASFGVGQILGPWLAGHAAERFGSFTLPLLGAGVVTAIGGLLLALTAAGHPGPSETGKF
ncbi:MAG: YbfB/YjiJ family MFS transporter [Desulfovibrionales bacterium]